MVINYKFYLFLGFTLLMNSCSSLQCTVEGPYKYCAPPSSFNPTISSPKLPSAYRESQTLQKQWLTSINDVASYLKEYNIPLFGKNIVSSYNQVFTQEQKGSITIKHIDNTPKVTYPKELPHFLTNEQLLYRAEMFSILRDLHHATKILSEHYLSSKLKVYIATSKNPMCDNKDICADGYGNLYIRSSLLDNPKKLQVILWHEASHLLPVGLNNKSLRKHMFKAVQSEAFKNRHKKIIEKNAHTGNYSLLQLISKENPNTILNNALNNEFEIDAQVLSLIKNDTQLCIAYGDSLNDAPNKSRAKIIKSTCKYMENYKFIYSPSLLRSVQEKIQLLNQNFENFLSNRIQDKNFKKILFSRVTEAQSMNKKELIKAKESFLLISSIMFVVEKNYENSQTRDIMLKWYTQILNEFMYGFSEQTKFRDSFQEI